MGDGNGSGDGGTGFPTEELRSAPGTTGPYLRAVLPKRRGGHGGAVPPRRLVLRDVAVDPERLRQYAGVCGFADGGREGMPLTYPHVVAFPAALSLMTRADFPLPLPGLVHVANRVERTRPLEVGERLTYRVWADRLRPHPRGTAFDVTAEADDGDGPVWRSVSTYLRRGRGATTAGSGRRSDPSASETPGSAPGAGGASSGPGAPEVEEEWEVSGSVGRAYAAVSGDRNPIHLHPLTARLLGFPRAIAHGMWSKARCLAALDDRLPDACRVDVSFRAPVPLPARVRLRADRAGGATGTAGVLWDFRLLAGDGPREHLRGEVSSLG